MWATAQGHGLLLPLHPSVQSCKTFISETRDSLWASDGTQSKAERDHEKEAWLVWWQVTTFYPEKRIFIFCFIFETVNKSSPLCCPSAVLEWAWGIVTLTLVSCALANGTECQFYSLPKPQSSHLQNGLPRPHCLPCTGLWRTKWASWQVTESFQKWWKMNVQSFGRPVLVFCLSRASWDFKLEGKEDGILTVVYLPSGTMTLLL